MKTLIILLLLSLNAYGQTQRKITYEQTHQFTNNVRGEYEIYQDHDSAIYTVGDTIKFSIDRDILKFDKVDKIDTVQVLGGKVTQAYCTIQSIKVVGNKRIGYTAKLTMEAYEMMYLLLESNKECLYEGRIMFIIKFKV